MVYHDDELEAGYHLLCELLTHSFQVLPAVLLLLTYLQIHISILCLFLFVPVILLQSSEAMDIPGLELSIMVV